MASSLILKNNIGSELKFTHDDGNSALEIGSSVLEDVVDKLKYNYIVDTVASFRSMTDTPETVYVKDGTYGSNIFKKVIGSNPSDNGGTIIRARHASYELQFDGPIHAEWFGYTGTHLDEQDRMAAKLGSEAHHVKFADCYSVYWNGTKWQGKSVADRIYAVRINKNVRYIRVGSNGSSINTDNHLVEIQAFEDGINVAKGTANSNSLTSNRTFSFETGSGSDSYDIVTDENTSAAEYVRTPGSQYIQLDLGGVHSIDTVSVWRYWLDARTYTDSYVKVSEDGTTWHTISDGNDYAETSAGKSWTYAGVVEENERNLVEYIDGRVNLVYDKLADGNINVPYKDNKVRYIRLSSNGSTTNTGNPIVELKVMNDTTNLLDPAGFTISSSNFYMDTSRSSTIGTAGTNYSVINDGDTSTNNYFQLGGRLVTWVLDLGSTQPVTSVKIWRYYHDGRTFNSTKIEVSKDGLLWHTITDGVDYAETASGKEWLFDGIRTTRRENFVTYINNRLNDITPYTNTQLKAAVREAIANGTPVNDINVTGVTDFSNLFKNLDTFNEPLDKWDTSSATNMRGMFYNCQKFNQPISNFDTSNVTDMYAMFYKCYEFNQSLSNFDTSSLRSMYSMFGNCTVFNQQVNHFSTDKVRDMRSVFFGCEAFNQPLDNWNVSNVTTMNSMFYGATVFNQDISSWDVSNVTEFRQHLEVVIILINH